MILAFVLYYLLGKLLKRARSIAWSQVMAAAVVNSAAYVSYSLGANDVGNAIGPLLGKYPDKGIGLAIRGGVAMAVGAFTFGARVTDTVGKSITPLDYGGALSAQLPAAFGVNLFSMAGIPVSTSQAAVVYRLVESVDAIAGQAEDVARFIFDQEPLLEIYHLSLNCFTELRKALRDYFKPKGQIESLHEHVNRVCEIETEADVKESALARTVFGTSLELAQKIPVEQLNKGIGNIADLSEDASDELEFSAMKSVV